MDQEQGDGKLKKARWRCPSVFTKETIEIGGYCG